MALRVATDSAGWKGYWLKGKENLDIALMAYEKEKYNACASRAYYAVFLASIAALIKLTSYRGKGDEWQHAAVRAELNRQLIMRKKILTSNLRRTSMDLIELRHVADYKEESVSARAARKACGSAQQFLSEVGKALGEPL